MVICVGGVAVSRNAFGIALSLAFPRTLWLWCPAVLGPLGLIPSFCLMRREQICIKIGLQPGFDDLLGVGAEVDHAFPFVVLTFVRVGAIFPDFALHVDVNCPQHARLTWPAGRPKLEINHGPNLRSDEWLDGCDVLFRDGLDWLGLDGFPNSEAFDRA